jgi:DNA-binding MarR family transcriptional regulator
MSKSIEMLVRKDWVERWIDKTDRRQTLVRLTANGRRVLDDSRAHLEELLDRRLAAIPAIERNALAVRLRRVRDALSQT